MKSHAAERYVEINKLINPSAYITKYGEWIGMVSKMTPPDVHDKGLQAKLLSSVLWMDELFCKKRFE